MATVQGVRTAARAPAAAGRVLLGTLALAASARLALPLAPVPVTGQTLAVLLVGVLLGRRDGTVSVLSYLAAGAAGLPVFTAGGGLAYLLGPTGGYLLGFLPAVWLAGELAERGWTARPGSCLLLMALSLGAVFACGLAWLSLYVPAGRLLGAGLLPFLPGEALKMVLAALIVCRRRRPRCPRWPAMAT